MSVKQILFISYALFLLSVTVFSYTFVDSNLSYLNFLYSGFATQKRAIVTILFIFIISLSFVYYFLFLRLLQKKQLSLTEVKILIGIAIGLLFFSYPAMLSYDIFNYIATAKVLFLYWENPYILMPIDFPHEPLLAFMHAANKTALYGPSWLVISGVPHSIGVGNFLLTLFSFKLFIVLFFLATVRLIWKISNNTFSVLLFSLNPLIIVETIVSGHNDIVMIFFALMAYYLLVRKKIWLAIPFFLLSVFIKYATLFLVPVFAYALWKTYRKEKVHWSGIFYYSCLSLFVIFFLSPIREEIYPWYALWFLPFAFLIPERKLLLFISLIFSFSLLFRYIPFMLTGNYFGMTPVLKIALTFFPLCIGLVLLMINKLWRKTYFR